MLHFRPHACGEEYLYDLKMSRQPIFRPHACGEEWSGISKIGRAAFQTPRVWGREVDCRKKGGSFLSDPTRVGKSNNPVNWGHWEEFQTPRVWGRVRPLRSPDRMGLSDPTRVGKRLQLVKILAFYYYIWAEVKRFLVI